MRTKLLTTICLTLCTLMAAAQADLTHEGSLVAHDVVRQGVVPPALEAMLGGRQLRQQPSAQRLTTARRQPSRAKAAGYVAATTTTVGPLLSSIRDQEEPYNLMCPRWTDAEGNESTARCLSGCVATAIEQIMAYYRYPEALIDTLHGWQTPNYTLVDLLPGTRFDWDNYLSDYRYGWTQAQGEAIALPSLAAGMAVHMQYGLDASGANVWTALEPLQRAFGYGMVSYVERILYTPARWHSMLHHELDAGRPIVYAGHNMALSGHAFNVDGYDADGYYHVNWGYNGSYDGWYDLDWLNPWEPKQVSADGIAEGFFCNQSALFMHPSADARPLEPDTLALDALGVELKEVTFLRQPDTQQYVMADFTFVNHATDSVTYTYEVMTFLPTDTAIFEQADYVGLAGFTIAPSAKLTQRVYLQFAETGDRLLGISHDDVTIPFTTPVRIAKGTPARLEWGSLNLTSVDLTPDGLYDIEAHVNVSNVAASGTAGSLVTFCLGAESFTDGDTRHYEVLQLPAGSTADLSVAFTGLEPQTSYTLLVRCPWAVQAQLTLTTPARSAVTSVNMPSAAPISYDLAGRRASSHTKVTIENGRKSYHR